MPGAPSAIWRYVLSEIFQFSSVKPTENLQFRISHPDFELGAGASPPDLGLGAGAISPSGPRKRPECSNRLPHTIAQTGLQNVDFTYWNRTLLGAEHVPGIMLLLLYCCRLCVGANGLRYDRTTGFISVRDRT